MPNVFPDISRNIEKINEKVRIAAEKCGRKFSDVVVLAASKTRNINEIIAAYESGIKIFGENYVQEFLGKYDLIQAVPSIDIDWHIIGHLQKNKARFIVGKTSLIHSVDDVSLANMLDALSAKKQTVTNILIEINVAGEKSKNGVLPDGAVSLIKSLNGLQNISLKGLMSMPPPGNSNRDYFKSIKGLLSMINQKNIYKDELFELSMGTSDDFETAIEEGSTMVRLGTVLFGQRPPKKTAETRL